MPETLEQFAAKVKQKYPQYQNVQDIELVGKILAKYPQYRERITFEPPGPPAYAGLTPGHILGEAWGEAKDLVSGLYGGFKRALTPGERIQPQTREEDRKSV